MNGVILLPLVVITYHSSFYKNDEIYSWGMWAVQHYQSMAPTYQITGAAYPQLFPIIISYCFKLLGNVEYQATIKIALLIFPFTALQTIATASKHTMKLFISYLILAFLSIFPGDFYSFYSKAYADPMMIACLLSSIALFIKYFSASTPNRYYLWLSVCCGITASLTKQPALWWSMVIFPAWCIIHALRMRQINRVELAAAAVMVYPILLWLTILKFGLFQNHPVVIASMQSRTIVQQLLYATHKYIINFPSFFILLALTSIACLQKKILTALFLLLIVPYIFIWFLLGAYDLRLGVHITGLCGLIIACNDYCSLKLLFSSRVHSRLITSIIVISIIISCGCFIKLHYRNSFSTYPMEGGGRTTLNSMYGNDGNYLYDHIYNRIGDPFNYDALYGHATLLYPDNYFVGHYEISNLLNDIKHNIPDYVISSGKAPSHMTNIVESLVQKCPGLFHKVASGNTQYQFAVYQLNKSDISRCNLMQNYSVNIHRNNTE